MTGFLIFAGAIAALIGLIQLAKHQQPLQAGRPADTEEGVQRDPLDGRNMLNADYGSYTARYYVPNDSDSGE